MKGLWKRWLFVSRKISTIQANIILFIVYFVIIVPLGIGLRIFAPHILLGHRVKKKRKSFWISYPKTTYDMNFAKKQ